MLEMDQLRSFAVAAETLNFSVAGHRLGRVQSAISAQIAKLEEVTGQTLFERGKGRPVSLTPAGERLLVHAERLLRLNAEALRSMQTQTSESVVRFGTTETYATAILVRALSLFKSLQPEARIEIQCGSSPHLLDLLDTGQLDLVLVTDQRRRSDRLWSHECPLVWVASPSSDLGKSRALPVAFMPPGCEFRRAGLRALEQVGREWTLTMSSPSPSGIRVAVQAGLAVTVMPSAAVDRTMMRIVGEDEGLPPLGSISVVAHAADTDLEPAAGVLIEQIRFALQG